MKGNFSESELESIRVDNGSERDREKLPLLQPPSVLQIEEVAEASDTDEQDKGNNACCRICLESESSGPGFQFTGGTLDKVTCDPPSQPGADAFCGGSSDQEHEEMNDLKTYMFLRSPVGSIRVQVTVTVMERNWGRRIDLAKAGPPMAFTVPRDELISPCMCKGTQQFVHRSCLDHWRAVKEGFAFSHCTTCKAQFHLRPELPEDYSWRKIKFKLFVARDVLLVFLAVQTTVSALGGVTYLMDYNGQFRNSFSDGWDRVLSKHPVPFYYGLGLLSNVGLLSLCHLRPKLSPSKIMKIRIISHLVDMQARIRKQLEVQGVFIFFVILGISGLVVHCSSVTNHDPCMGGCRDACYGWGILDCFPASVEACGALLVIFVVIFAILGIAYCLLAATMAVQRIWQRHYHILTKRVLTKEYIVEDMHGNYYPPTLSAEHADRLKGLNLL